MCLKYLSPKHLKLECAENRTSKCLDFGTVWNLNVRISALYCNSHFNNKLNKGAKSFWSEKIWNLKISTFNAQPVVNVFYLEGSWRPKRSSEVRILRKHLPAHTLRRCCPSSRCTPCRTRPSCCGETSLREKQMLKFLVMSRDELHKIF